MLDFRKKPPWVKMRRRMAWVSFLILLLSGVDFLLFYKRVTQLPVPTNLTADAVIVLTGDAGRIAAGPSAGRVAGSGADRRYYPELPSAGLGRGFSPAGTGL